MEVRTLPLATAVELAQLLLRGMQLRVPQHASTLVAPVVEKGMPPFLVSRERVDECHLDRQDPQRSCRRPPTMPCEQRASGACAIVPARLHRATDSMATDVVGQLVVFQGVSGRIELGVEGVSCQSVNGHRAKAAGGVGGARTGGVAFDDVAGADVLALGRRRRRHPHLKK